MNTEARGEPMRNCNNKPGADGRWKAILAGVIRVVDFIKYFFRLLYQARISVISAAIGIAIFTFAVQSMDLFLEVRSSPWPERIYWTVFYFLLIFTWLLPVYFFAILSIDWEHRLSKATGTGNAIEDTKTAEFFRKLVPLLLVCGCLFALGRSQYETHWEFTDLLKYIIEKKVPISTDLPIPNTLLLIQATMLAAVLFISSRVTLAFEGQLTITYFFVSIGMCLFAVIGWFLWFHPQNEMLKYYDFNPEDNFMIIYGLPLLQWIRLCFPLIMALLWIFTYASIFKIRHKFPDWRDAIVPAIVITVICWLILLIVDPASITRFADRALLLPVVLGVWVPLFSILSWGTARTGLPVVIIFLVLLAVLAMTNKAHFVTAKEDAAQGQIELRAAIDHWKRANSCADASEQCPPLVLVAAQGGASRSAFFTTAALGRILDENGVGSVNRIFAMSGVSGGSAGIAFFSAALKDGRQPSAQASPCRMIGEIEAGERNTFSTRAAIQDWYGAANYKSPRQDWASAILGLNDYKDLDDKRPYNASWQNCLEVLASGDFLSPVFLRMSGVDFVGLNTVLENIGEGLGADRAVALEKAWERHYKRITGKDSLSSGFLSFGPDPSPEGEWRPLLLLNATSAPDGRRVIASHLYPSYCDGNGSVRRIFNDAHDLHEIFNATLEPVGGENGDSWRYGNGNCNCIPAGAPRKYNLQCKDTAKSDFKLSTAASLSSRFPIVSPQADIVAGGVVRARVVDGGYFENFGATSLIDLVTAIEWIEPGLPIHVIMITNDPTLEREDCLAGVKKDDPQDRASDLPRAQGYQFWSGFRAILDAMFSTRTARGANAAINLCKLQWVFNKLEFTHIRVKQTGIRDISMSWWLSYPVQLYLDRQLDENPDAFARIGGALTRKGGS